jgi:multifunctional methyltransferase subunit TRM112
LNGRAKEMKLLTHNHLKSPVKNVNKGYPMLLEIEDMEIQQTLRKKPHSSDDEEENEDDEEMEDEDEDEDDEPGDLDETKLEFIKSILPSLDWEGILLVSKQIEGFQDILPETFDNSLLEDNSFLEAMYSLLIDINIVKGKLICPETKREFLIENGIPNLM